MSRFQSRLERALFAVAVAAAAILLVTVPRGEAILTGDTIPIAVAAGVAVYASAGGDCDTCSCC